VKQLACHLRIHPGLIVLQQTSEQREVLSTPRPRQSEYEFGVMPPTSARIESASAET
jgi:hypothetical protein